MASVTTTSSLLHKNDKDNPNQEQLILIKSLKQKSASVRQRLAQQFGIKEAEKVGRAVTGRAELRAKRKLRKLSVKPKLNKTKKSLRRKVKKVATADFGGLDPDKEEYMFTSSTVFLKGTQSDNQHNDFSQHFINTGERAANFIIDGGLKRRFEEYPKLRELIQLKDALIRDTNPPPMYLRNDLTTFNLAELKCQFEVILIEPPLEEHRRTRGMIFDKYWSWEEIIELQIEQIAAQRSFIWIWCGNSDGLDWGRRCLKKWGFRRCEDICWIKTNRNNPGLKKDMEPNALFQRTKEHLLMGIKGTVRRSTDGDFIHANVDIDLILAEEPEYGSKDYPIEVFHLIEHFCLGRRRLHLFGRDSTIRPGWLTVGPEISSSNFDAEAYQSYFVQSPGLTTGCTEDIERLRPKSPPPKGKPMGDGIGRGRTQSAPRGSR